MESDDDSEQEQEEEGEIDYGAAFQVSAPDGLSEK